MPTIILLDVSLSMYRPVQCSDSTDNLVKLSLANVAITTFLDYLAANYKLEYVCLVTFSSNYEVVVPFTRDFEAIKSKLPHLEEGDKTCIDAALHGVNQLVISEWGNQTPVQIILITDGSAGVGPIGRARIIQNLPSSPNYPARLHVLPICTQQDACLQHSMPLYQHIIEHMSSHRNNGVMNQRGVVYVPENLNLAGVTTAMNKLIEQQYTIAWGVIKCGQLESRVQLFPAPPSGAQTKVINIIGFISVQDLGSPITMSRHLIIPQSNVNAGRESFEKTLNKENGSESTSEEELDPSKIPNFCVLLHGALKVENMSCIARINDECFGAVSAWCESTRGRRSCVLLSVFKQGEAAPWLGDLTMLGPEDEGDCTDVFPIKASRSYSAGAGNSGSAWSRPHALLADVQKVLRHARKMPDKTQHLYKELNRLRRVAISLGFAELLTSVGLALERECAALPPHSPPECALQLAHAAATLRDPRTMLDIHHTLQPLQTNFTLTDVFPIKASRSYSAGAGNSGSAWSRPHALLADVQKVLRHARKMPDKIQHLYKELNRLRRVAISLGFAELLTSVGLALERECAALPPHSPPECALQLAHAAATLRDPRTMLDIHHTLQPLQTNFTLSGTH